jgi:hypothetical protein
MAANDPTIIKQFKSAPVACTVAALSNKIVHHVEITNALRTANSTGVLTAINVIVDGTLLTDDQLNCYWYKTAPTSNTTIGNTFAHNAADDDNLLGVNVLANPRYLGTTKCSYTGTILTIPLNSATSSVWLTMTKIPGSDTWAAATTVEALVTTVWS